MSGDSATWSTATPESPAGSKGIAARSQHTASLTSDGRFLFIFGGYDGDKNLNDMWLLDMQVRSASCPRAVITRRRCHHPSGHRHAT